MAAAVNPTTCLKCHGASFEKHADGLSKIVKNLTHEQITSALIGFKRGTFKNATMQHEVSKYSIAELKAFAQTIGK